MASIPDSQIYCPVRREWVTALPEEIVRQSLIKDMVENKGYPLMGLVVEKPLNQFPHLSHRKGLPNRRADIVCFVKAKEGGLLPLLLIECKAEEWTEKAISQVLGYNHYLGALYIALADSVKVRTGKYDPTTQSYTFAETLPSFHELAQTVYAR